MLGAEHLRPSGSLDLHSLLEQCRCQNNSRYAQSLQETGMYPRWLKCANDLTVRTDSLPYESEDILHTDDLLVHTCDLGDVDDFAGAVAKP